ncbi:actin-like protein arp8 [Coemansia pectinata]|uniref:Actin-like protein arp8 n=1 Tax=Coemansia pectinata TaxID=1052879 RepID=A0A9W8GXU4_9FUNG|nr:actin-like protein arp8 [Coemansia pectinata]
MSGINIKRKKYSWLPESNPAAVSGESSSGVGAAAKTEPKDKRVRQPRQFSRGVAKQRAREKAARAAIEGLGITSTDGQTPEVAIDANPEPTSGDADASRAEGEDTPVVVTPQDDAPKARRKHRKDSVDELVRSRLSYALNPWQDDQLQEGQHAESHSSASKPRKRADHPTSSAVMSSITASVRDALVSEHTHSSHRSSSSQAHVGSTTNASSSRQHANHHSARPSHFFGSNDDVAGPNTRRKAAGVQNGTRLDRINSAYSFPSYVPLNVIRCGSKFKKTDRGVGSPLDYENRGLEVTTGENVIVLHAGSRWMRIGRASDAVPKELPHAVARRFNPRQPPTSNSSGSATVPAPAPAASSAADAVDTDGNDLSHTDGQPHAESNDASTVQAVSDTDRMELDTDIVPAPEASHNGANHGVVVASRESESDSEVGPSDSELAEPGLTDTVDKTLTMLREALKQHQRQSKRKVPPNVYSQVLTYNKQSRSETIRDHNDPFKIEWIVPSMVSDDYVVGENVLRVAESEEFVVRYPIRNGCFNVEDYESIEEVLGDIETIWMSAITNELGIPRKNLAKFGVVLVIPDIFSRVEVTLLAELLLRQMGFQYLLVQQSSALVTFGAGFSSACVVDVGAQKTSIACVENGFCHQESRVSIMYGGDDITRFLHSLFMRSNFPYHEASLSRAYDWTMINELREKYCTMNLSDVNIRLHNFFVRQPKRKHTQKYSFKAYDEVYQAPFCLFYPSIVDAYYHPPDYANTFVNAIAADTFGDPLPPASSTGLPTLTQFGIFPSKAEPVDGAVHSEDESDEPLLQMTAAPATAPATVPATAPGTPDPRGPPIDATAGVKEALLAVDAPSRTSPSTPSMLPSVSYVPDFQAQYSRMPLDQAVTHSITHVGSIESVKKLYSSIVIVGGGVSFIPGFGELLANRLMYTRPSYLRGVVERADIVSAPRDLDPRVLAWKGGAVLSRLECSKEMWVSNQEWSDFGPRLLRDRVLFQW